VFLVQYYYLQQPCGKIRTFIHRVASVIVAQRCPFDTKNVRR